MIFGETMLRVFGKQQFVSLGNLERTGAPLLDLDLDAVLVFQLATHTERPGLIVSSAAVFDVYGLGHGCLP